MLTGFTRRFEGVISASMLNVLQEVANKSRKVLFFAIASFVFAVLLSAGVIITLLEASAQLDTRGILYFSALLTSGSVMIGLSLISLAFILWPRTKTLIPSSAFQTPPPPPKHSPLEESLASLVNQFVSHMKEKHQAEAAVKAQTQTPQPTDSKAGVAPAYPNTHQHFDATAAN